MIRLSAGTAALLGMQKCKLPEPPTTAYIMSGQGCINNCSFCAQARTSSSPVSHLSRVTWPEFSLEEMTDSLSSAFEQGKIQRTCLQVVNCPQGISMLYETLESIKKAVPEMPISVSASLDTVKEIKSVLESGADVVNISLDGAAKRVFEAAKGKSWKDTWALLTKASRRYPNRIRTHVICGLGEKEIDVCETIQKCTDLEIGVGLFAFTPVKGTALETLPRPPLQSYRRIQAAHYLITNRFSRREYFSFRPGGKIEAFGIHPITLEHILKNGKAFETSGCRGCNRPYYNESPRQVPYNYPRRLTRQETAQAIRAVLQKD